MEFHFTNEEPIYRQIAEQLEAAIFTGAFAEGSQVPSTTEISKQFNVNPATILKGMNQLVEKGLLEKRRGLGMFVTAGAHQQLQQQRRTHFLQRDVHQFITAAKALNITAEELEQMIMEGYSDEHTQS
ncbi:GntR family transcriptional regulator [Loigolactobacillus backii]|uniref:GntR family transcriptional regulator n=1 Tax=Loigolactobacillus backii TaxID=375175 RepID=A0A192H3V1_9LACO|nr:GntR family transcriptional regulator [Loigolactobacillus backii]ANK59541.1 GntR family transcriptional regulator [Loigolactobacillus backii]ANK62897.1 GntR family transcriptional regulator [Loigolactobacillus backii]ANK64535.1 GntR family transcriptional regulator [Loigolactobacillus backii]ANK67069.1 GntR family transcriptional regulator [Loigolactobacillus backii]ANK70095.1 GntR family transcriptional regulator [Loigolactobacillus backii]